MPAPVGISRLLSSHGLCLAGTCPGRQVCRCVLTCVAVLLCPQLAMMVLNALASRLEVVATMVLSNWSHVSQGLEQVGHGRGVPVAHGGGRVT